MFVSKKCFSKNKKKIILTLKMKNHHYFIFISFSYIILLMNLYFKTNHFQIEPEELRQRENQTVKMYFFWVNLIVCLLIFGKVILDAFQYDLNDIVQNILNYDYKKIFKIF